MNASTALSRVGARTLARQTNRAISLKDDNLFLSLANVPDVPVAPGDEGGIIDVRTGVANGAIEISEFDEDRCTNDANPCVAAGDLVGYCYNLSVEPVGAWGDPQETGPTCIPITAVGATEQEHNWAFQAPHSDFLTDGEGTFSIQFLLEADGTGELGAFSLPVTVQEGATVRPGVGSPEVDEDTSGGGGGGGNGDGPALSGLQSVLALAIVLVILLQASG